MSRLVLIFLASGVCLLAQSRYIVEMEGPAASAATRGSVRFSAAEPAIAARLTQIRGQHAAVEPLIRAAGGTVRARFDAVFNGLAVEMTPAAAAQVRRMPAVAAVWEDIRHQVNMDRAVNVHKIRDAWQAVVGGQMGAGAGIKIGIIDSGIDTAHPAFQGFATEIPKGFPILSSEDERVHSNSKVIVVRDYTGVGGLDTFGHGTGVAMVAAGLMTDPQIAGLGAFTGVAPGAWLGNYRVVDNSGGSFSSLFLQALQDAVYDGMNVVNYSAGGAITDSIREDGPESRAINAAVAAGVLVVISAGNAGPEPGTLGTPGLTLGALTAGANYNERVLDDAVVVADLPPFQARASSGTDSTSQVRAPIADVTALDGNGFGCAGFPLSSLTGQIALISRSIVGADDGCSFETKVQNAQLSGAVGVAVYNSDPDAALVGMAVESTLPSTFVSQASGVAIKKYLADAPGAAATLDFSFSTAFTVSSDVIPTFSSRGPTPGGGLKPDLLATGAWVLTADTTQNNPYPPYLIEDGTSFSAPIVSGAAAVLMAARPGLTAADYRSLLADTPAPLTVKDVAMSPQTAGAGKLDLMRALQSTIVASPSSINYKTVAGTFDLTQSIDVKNSGTDPDTFTVAVKPINEDGVAPTVDTQTFSLDAGATKTLQVHLTATDPAAGAYQGFLEIAGTKNAVSARIPYWLGVRGTSAKYIALQSPVDLTTRSFQDEVLIIFRSLDLIGAPIDAGEPTVTTVSSRAAVLSVAAVGNIPGSYQADVRIGRAASTGINVFTITVGGISRDVTFFIQ